MIGDELKKFRDEDPIERSGGDEWGEWRCCYFVGTNLCHCQKEDPDEPGN